MDIISKAIWYKIKLWTFELQCDTQCSLSNIEIHPRDECGKNGSSDTKYYWSRHFIHHSPHPSGHVGSMHHNFLQTWKKTEEDARSRPHSQELENTRADHCAVHVAVFISNHHEQDTAESHACLCSLAGEYQRSPQASQTSFQVGFQSDCSEPLAFFLEPMCLGKFTFNFYCLFLITKYMIPMKF